MGYAPKPDWFIPTGLPSTWSNAELEVHIHGCAESSRIEWTTHSGVRSTERSLSKPQLRRVAQYGRLTRRDPPNPGFTGVNCKMEHTLPSDGDASVIVAITDSDFDRDDPYISIVTDY